MYTVSSLLSVINSRNFSIFFMRYVNYDLKRFGTDVSVTIGTDEIFCIYKFDLLETEIKLEDVRLIFLARFAAEKCLKFQSGRKMGREERECGFEATPRK